MKRVVLVVAVLSIVSLISVPAPSEVLEVGACTANTPLVSPAGGAVSCATESAFITPVLNGWSMVGRARVDGIGLVSGIVEIQQSNDGGNTWFPQDSSGCGAAVGSCEAAQQIGAGGVSSGGFSMRAVCFLNGVLAASGTVTCEMTFVVG